MAPFILNPPPQTLLARHRQLAPTAAVRVSPVCFIVGNFGEGAHSKSNAFALLDGFYSKGGNFFHTPFWKAEPAEWLGAWMVQRKNRDELVLSAGYSNNWKRHDKHALPSNYGGNSMKSMRLSLEQTLSKLQTTYLDIYCVSFWDGTTTIPESMHGLNDLVMAGKVLYLGICETPAWVVAKANEYARQKGLRQFAVYLGQWSAAERDMERDIVPMCQAEGMAICSYGSTDVCKPRLKQHSKRPKATDYAQRHTDVSEALAAVAKAKGITARQTELAYIMGKAPYVFGRIPFATIKELDGIIAGLSVTLSEEAVSHIESAYDFDFGFPHSALSGTRYTGEKSKGADHPANNEYLKALGAFDWVGKLKAIGHKGK